MVPVEIHFAEDFVFLLVLWLIGVLWCLCCQWVSVVVVKVSLCMGECDAVGALGAVVAFTLAISDWLYQ